MLIVAKNYGPVNAGKGTPCTMITGGSCSLRTITQVSASLLQRMTLGTDGDRSAAACAGTEQGSTTQWMAIGTDRDGSQS